MNELTANNPRRWFVRAKLDAPRQQVSLLARQRLVSVLDEAVRRPLCVVVAPAGFGKTTLIAQWREQCAAVGASVAWLSLDEDDADLRQFLSYLIFALSEAGVNTGRLEALAEQGLTEISIDSAFGALLQAAAGHIGQVVLVLDDYHRIMNPETDEALERMIDALPPNFSLIVSTRLRPELSLGRRVAAGQAAEIDGEMLRFSAEETRAVIRPDLTDDQLGAVFQRTEGWGVAVQLARLAIDGDRPIDAALEGLAGHGGHLAAYLADQVLDQLPEDLPDFLIQTAILDRFNAPLANAVCQRSDAWDVLDRLQPLQSLLVPLEEPSDWYRYHHLFAEHLQGLLQRRMPDAIPGLHMRASVWYAKQGYISDAVRHARLGGDLDRCAKLIEDAGGWELILYGGIGYLRNLLRNIPLREAAAYPRVQIAFAYLALKEGNLPDARMLLNQVRETCGDIDPLEPYDAPLARDFVNICALADMYEDQRYDSRKAARLEQLLDQTPSSDGLTTGVLICAFALVSMANGNIRIAEDRSREAMRAMRAAGSVLGLNYCFLHAGGASLYQGRLQKAEANFRQARQMAEDNFGADSGLRSLADLLLSALLHWRDEWKAGDHSEFRRAVAHVETYDGWFEIYAQALDVEVAAALDQQSFAAAEEAIRRAEQTAAERGIRRLTDISRAHRLWLLALKGEAAAGAALAERLEADFPKGIWKENIFAWRPYQAAGAALALHHAQADRSRSIAILEDMEACARSIGAELYTVQAMAMKAGVLDKAGNRDGALATLLDALLLAAPERLRRPFRNPLISGSLLAAVRKKARNEAMDIVLLDFISECLEVRSVNDDPTGALEALGLSAREQEVVQELANGSANKEIARALDLTEHTVKFHLKNIFKKLGVERRTQAVARIRDLEGRGETYPNG